MAYRVFVPLGRRMTPAERARAQQLDSLSKARAFSLTSPRGAVSSSSSSSSSPSKRTAAISEAEAAVERKRREKEIQERALSRQAWDSILRRAPGGAAFGTTWDSEGWSIGEKIRSVIQRPSDSKDPISESGRWMLSMPIDRLGARLPPLHPPSPAALTTRVPDRIDLAGNKWYQVANHAETTWRISMDAHLEAREEGKWLGATVWWVWLTDAEVKAGAATTMVRTRRSRSMNSAQFEYVQVRDVVFATELVSRFGEAISSPVWTIVGGPLISSPGLFVVN